jgi:CheY-like chemotaxis protein
MTLRSDEAFPYVVLGDQPYTKSEDPFGFAELAGELKRLILSSRGSTPFTLGIEASWGRGKSSLMGQLNQALRAEDAGTRSVDIRVVSFNAWTAEGEDVLEGLVKSVLEGMDPNALRRTLRRRRLMNVAKVPLLLVAGVARVGPLVDEAWDRLSVDARTRNQINGVVQQAMTEWLDQARRSVPQLEGDRLLVVFIDDLDRCSPANVLKVFEGLKLYLDAPGFVFVIGYDEGIVAEAVADQKQYSLRSTGRDYIEKIVQIVFRIPQPTDDEVERLLEHYLAESGTTALFDEPGRKLVIERNSRNPRRIKRFVNRFILDSQLYESSRELEPELLIKLLIFETYFPDFARLFSVANEKNPIQEFLDFAGARDALRRGEPSKPVVGSVFDFYGIATGGTDQEALERLEREAPEQFIRLVQDDDFLSLVRGVESEDDQELIVAKVQRREERRLMVVVDESAKGAPRSGDLGMFVPVMAGRRIVWVDDNHEKRSVFAERLRAAGADVHQVDDTEAAVEVLSTMTPDLLISDIGRGDRPDAGFEDLHRFRTEGLYGGPAIFYAARVSASRRTRAAELGAPIVNREEELLEAIGESLGADAAAPTPA